MLLDWPFCLNIDKTDHHPCGYYSLHTHCLICILLTRLANCPFPAFSVNDSFFKVRAYILFSKLLYIFCSIYLPYCGLIWKKSHSANVLRKCVWIRNSSPGAREGHLRGKLGQISKTLLLHQILS